MKARKSQFPHRPSVVRGRVDAASPETPPPQPSKPQQRIKRIGLARKRTDGKTPQPPQLPNLKRLRPLIRVAVIFFIIAFFTGNLHQFSRLGDTLSQFFQQQVMPFLDFGMAKRTSAPSSPSFTQKRATPTQRQPKALPADHPPVQATGDPLTLSISQVFRSVDFKIQARAHTLRIENEPDRLFRRLPTFTGDEQRYGVIALSGGQAYRFLLDSRGRQTLLYLDRNRNGDLTDDGPAIPNSSKGRFANVVKLPLAKVTGIASLKGDYELWLYSSPEKWQKGEMGVYTRTQLQGRVLLNGEIFDAYLADDHRLDGDYRNDGIGIDLNRDGKIDPIEYLPPGGDLVVGGKRYRVQITR